MTVAYAPRARRPRSHWSDDTPMTNTITVYEAESQPEDTGLLDANGTPLYRMVVRQSPGFRFD